MGADVDAAGLAQADRNIRITTNGVLIRFMVPLFIGKTKGQTDVCPRHDMSLRGRCSSARSNLSIKLGIASLSLAMTELTLSLQRPIFYSMRGQILPEFLLHHRFVIGPVKLL